MFSIYAGQNAGNKVTKEDMSIILQATGLDASVIDKSLEMMRFNQKQAIDFLDFISFIPFFVRVHNSIIGNVLKSGVDIEEIMGAKAKI